MPVIPKYALLKTTKDKSECVWFLSEWTLSQNTMFEQIKMNGLVLICKAIDMLAVWYNEA